MTGMLLWRGGLILAGAAVLFEATRWLLRFVDIPSQLKIGLGFLVAGATLVILSLIMERVRDSRAEGDLRK